MLYGKRFVGTVAPMTGLPSLLTDFFWSYSQMVEFNCEHLVGPRERIRYLRPRHSYHTVARNEISKEFQGEWLLMLDTDHSFEPDLLARLLHVMRTYQADVVSGLYLHKHHPCNPALWHYQEGKGFAPLVAWPKGEVMEVDCAGAGCLLIHRRVFDRIYGELGEDPFSTVEFDRGGGVTGEDFAFFKRLRKLGIKACCPTYIECNHLKMVPLEYDKHFQEEGLIHEIRSKKLVANAENCDTVAA